MNTSTMQAVKLLQPFGVDLFCLGKKYLVFNMVSRNLKSKYHRSFLGLFWTLLSPLSMAMIFYFVFRVVLNIQIPHYLAFILSGMLPWSFFTQTVVEGMESIVGSIALVTKVPIPLQIFPFVGAFTNLVTLTLAVPILIGTALVTGVSLGPSVLLLPVYLGLLFLFAYGLSTMLAIFFVLFRDLRHLMGIVLQLWLYATPIIYQETMIPDKYRAILYLNPVAFIFVDIHTILTQGGWPPLQHFSIACSWCFLSLAGAVLTHKYFGGSLLERI